MGSNTEAISNRYLRLASGEAALRTHLPPNAPLKFSLGFLHLKQRWEVTTTFHPENHPPLLLGQEDLEVFPSDDLIATAMLLA